jgi:hypothetical protein
MTDPVNKVGRTQEAERKKTHDGMVRSGKREHHSDEPANDSVDISEEARDRSSGRKRKTILEYLEDDG